MERARIPVTFVVTVPDYTKEGEGDVYIAGDFGTDTLPFWDPAGLPMTQIDDQHWTVTLEIPEGANAPVQVRARHVERGRKGVGMRGDRQPHGDGRSA